MGLIVVKILRVKNGKSKGKKIIPSASGMMRRAMACPVAVTTNATTTASGKLFDIFHQWAGSYNFAYRSRMQPNSPFTFNFFINVLGIDPALCLIRS